MTDDRVIWITGASSGIGEALVYELLDKGTQLIISARRREELERVKNACKTELRDNIHILELDLAARDDLEAQAKIAEKLFDKIDILINNGGVSQRDTALNTTMEVNRQIMEVNYFGAIALSKFVLPGMIKRQSGHHVIVSSVVGLVSTPRRSGYAASKHALHGFYDSLRAEHYGDNIHVTIVCPGYVKTNLSYRALKGDGSSQDQMDKTHENAMTPQKCARIIAKAIRKKKEEVYIGGAKEVTAIYIKRFLPDLYSKIIARMKVT